IIQESITNAMRHGGATEIRISIYQQDHSVYLEIQDNGVGCDEIHYGFGLKQMQERVFMVNGKIVLDGRNGFLTTVCLPIERGESYD
ncbi:MAG: sensor histidine kinase, partial [Coprobacillus sp.]